MALSQEEFDAMDKIVAEEQPTQNSYQPQETTLYQEPKPIEAKDKKWYNVTPSNLIDKGTDELVARLISPIKGTTIEDTRTELQQRMEDYRVQHPVLARQNKVQSWLLDQILYDLIGKKVKAGVGAVTGGFEATRHGQNPIAGAIIGGLSELGLKKVSPYAVKASANIQSAIMNSDKFKNFVQAMSGVPKAITERLTQNPNILSKALEKIKKNPNLSPDDIYAQEMRDEGLKAFNKYQEIDRASKKTLADYVEQNKNTPLEITNEELAKIFDDVFAKYSSKKYNAYQKSPNIVKDIQEELSGARPDLLSLDNLKRKWQNEASYISGEKIQASKYSDAEEKIAKELATKLNEALRRQHPEYARLNDIRSYMNDFAQRSGLNAKNIGDKFRAYSPQASGNTFEILNELNNILPAENKFIDKILDAQTANMFMQKNPIQSTTEQILTRKALPYAGMAVSGSNPVGFMAGILSAGKTSNPSMYGQKILKWSKNIENPSVKPSDYKIIENISRGTANLYPLIKGAVNKSDLDQLEEEEIRKYYNTP